MLARFGALEQGSPACVCVFYIAVFRWVVALAEAVGMNVVVILVNNLINQVHSTTHLQQMMPP